MYTILHDQYLTIELFDGFRYTEGAADQQGIHRNGTTESLSKTKFSRMQEVLDLSSFGLNRTDKKWFQGNRIMRNISELDSDMDSVNDEMNVQWLAAYKVKEQMFNYHFKKDSLPLPPALKRFKIKRDSIAKAKGNPITPNPATLGAPPPSQIGYDPHLLIGKRAEEKSDSIFAAPLTTREIGGAVNWARMVKSQLLNITTAMGDHDFRYKEFQIQWHKILSNSLACIVMFLIGAPLGAIIKKGGLGVPVLVSIFFFILFYLMSMIGEKWAKQGSVPVPVGIWTANVVLFIIGMGFLRQARVDARLFDADFYLVVWDKIKTWWANRKSLKQATA
jgi:lipopolysaccharide export system permease protein